jgi:DNA-binding XRE family transcriptional regulator
MPSVALALRLARALQVAVEDIFALDASQRRER